jgi:hypothetical protein
VDNLVSPQMAEYRRVYKDTLQLFMDGGTTGGQLEQELPAQLFKDIRGHLKPLPQTPSADPTGDVYFQQASASAQLGTFSIQDSRYSVFPRSLRTRLGFAPGSARTPVVGQTKHLTKSLSSIVSRAATAQSVKGLFTAGMIASVRYAFQKVLKRFK